ncbi:hypothetical protein NMY22_g618 [Coprinellus aureogranulatus]|nr:hypothetical protein NMY22_g618 [Coprinellus aureogranulatus]
MSWTASGVVILLRTTDHELKTVSAISARASKSIADAPTELAPISFYISVPSSFRPGDVLGAKRQNRPVQGYICQHERSEHPYSPSESLLGSRLSVSLSTLDQQVNTYASVKENLRSDARSVPRC